MDDDARHMEVDFDGYGSRIADAEARIRGMGSVAICFSGGLDSTVLADMAFRSLGDRAVAVMCDMPMMADRQRDAALAVARSIGIRLIVSKVDISEIGGILENRHDRCYICKTAMYSHVRRVASDFGISHVINGEIVDDLSEDRPGMAAGEENMVSTPFIDADVRRKDIVRYLGGMDLPVTLVKDTCMLMRFPEGVRVSMDDLRTVEGLEAAVRGELGLYQLRVRRTSGGFSVQTSSAEADVLKDGFDRIVPLFSGKGFSVELNPEPYDK